MFSRTAEFLILQVAPLVGAWIEIHQKHTRLDGLSVAPLVGAWIEIARAGQRWRVRQSHPLWVRGLKSKWLYFVKFEGMVAPLAGAWIEIKTVPALPLLDCRRTPCGCVD